MSRNVDTICILLGALTTTVVGAWLLQGLGAFLLGVLGAAGGYFFSKYIRIHLDNLTNKLKKKDDKAE